MQHETKTGAGFEAALTAEGILEKMRSRLSSHYSFECVDVDGNVKWTEEIDNLVTNEGLDDILEQYFKGSSYNALWYVGLIDNAAFSALAAGDTAAQIDGSNGWGELTEYSESVRESLILGSVASQSVDNSASKASFEIIATVTVNGAFLVSSGIKAGTAGVLYGEASFSSTRAMVAGDTLNVTVTLTSASA